MSRTSLDSVTRFIEGRAKSQVAQALKTPDPPESSQQSLFLGTVRGGCGELVANFLVSEPLFFSQVMVRQPCSRKSLSNKCYCLSDKKEPGPKAQLSSSEVQVLIRWGNWPLAQGWVPRPCPAIILEGARLPKSSWHSGSAGHPGGGEVPADCHIRSESRGRVVETVTAALARPVGDLSKGSGILQDTAHGLFPGLPAHPLARGQINWRAPGRMRFLPHFLL